MNNKVFLSLGSNLGNRKQNIENCIAHLNNISNMKVLKISSLYETSPMYNIDQRDFINCVIEVETLLKPIDLIAQTQSLEKKIGRDKILHRNQPRKIDIDILTYNDEIINEDNLKVPHPKIIERKFVLVPLLELKGISVIPGCVKKIEDLIEDLDKNSDKIRVCNYKINEENLSHSN
tara:strand:+ start:3386 stop:3916 length:531 start_codon:yes stop_codon:yes gene_type:complete